MAGIEDGPETRTKDTVVDGDVSTYLEDLLAGELPELDGQAEAAREVEVELVGPHLRLTGRVMLGRFRRLSDFLNNQTGLLELRHCTVLRRNGDPTRVTANSIWVSPTEVTHIGELDARSIEALPEFRIVKQAEPLIVVTPGHTITGNIYIPEGGSLAVFLESSEPAFIAMSDMRTRSLADRRIIARYPFAMLNRRHIVATTPLPQGMQTGRTVL